MIYWFILVILIFNFIYDWILEILQESSVKNAIPAVLKNVYKPSAYRKHLLYFSCNKRFGFWSRLSTFILSTALFAFGGFGYIDTAMRTITENPILLALLFFGIYYIISMIVSLPFDIYDTFVIEQRFGFNRTTVSTFIKDFFVSALVNIVLDGSLISLCIWVYMLSPAYFWIFASIVMVTFMLAMQYLYSDLIVPLFNKQTPLPDGELRSAISAFADKVGFGISDIYVMDSSKRTTKANAYFTGFGNKKRIVLYDTLIEQMTTDEIVAVLAHEIGHYKKHHVWKSTLVEIIMTIFTMWLFSIVISNPSFAYAAGATVASFHVNMIVFSILLSPINIITNMLMNYWSRKHEWEADEFAKIHGCAADLVNGLKKLSASTLSNLTPHKFVVFMEYSHPTLYDRVIHLIK